jgi:hypothetical protein
MARVLATSLFDRGVLAIAGMFALAAGIFAAGAGVPDTETKILARQQAIDPPQLWRVDALSADGAVRASVFVCADTSLREAFVRTRAEVNGEICKDTTSPVLKENGWALRCQAHGWPFAVSATTVGDPQQDFRLNFGLTQLYYLPTANDPPAMSVRQSRHFRRIGACPTGWRIGDQAKPGHKPRA